jgi:glycosyltransferase involved in cell wall biosynthesis
MIAPVEVVLPCLNEAESLPGVLGALPPGCTGLVVDNGSTDATAEVATAWGARVVLEQCAGYGAAVHTGLEQARTDIVAVLDADGSLDPGALPELIAAVSIRRFDLAVGRRVPVGRGVQPWHASAANAAFAAMVRRRGLAVHDIAPMRVCRRSALVGLGVTDRGFGYPLELLLRAADAGWRVHEVDVAYRPRSGGRSKVSGSVRGTWRAARDMTAVVLG